MIIAHDVVTNEGCSWAKMLIAAWAKKEVQGADLAVKRLQDRFVTLLSDLGSQPNLSIPAACRGPDEIKAAYRFFDNDKVTFDKIRHAHQPRTKERLAEHNVVWLVQDTTEIDLTRTEPVVTGAGELDGARRGWLWHERHAFTTDAVPLGTVWAETVHRTAGIWQASAAERQHQRQQTPIEEKESRRWLTTLRDSSPRNGRRCG